MDLPDCPPGTEGYQDSVTEVPVPKKPELEESSCTKAEFEFQEHLNSLKIRLEDGSSRCMVERRGRDISGSWIYLCYPCAAVCSGESILQTHISGKKHKVKLSMRKVWPNSIFDEHPYNNTAAKSTERVSQKMEDIAPHMVNPSDMDKKYNKYKNITCHIQDSLDSVKAPLLGVEYLIEHPPEQPHYEPTYMCTLCSKQGHPRTIINHMTCFWHRFNYLVRHFSQASLLLSPYRTQFKYRDGVNVIMNRLAQRIEDKYGRKKPVNIDKEEYEKEKVQIHEWLYRSHHFSEKDGVTFVEVVDTGLIDSLLKKEDESKTNQTTTEKDPSPPVVAAPSRPLFNNFSDPGVVVQVGAVRKRTRTRPRTRPPRTKRGKVDPDARPGPSSTVPTDTNNTVAAVLTSPLMPESSGGTVPVKLQPGAPGPATAPGSAAQVSSHIEAPGLPIYPDKVADRPAGRVERRAGSVESLSDISDEGEHERRDPARDWRVSRDRQISHNKGRFEPYDNKRRASPIRNRQVHGQNRKSQEKQQRPSNYEYKLKLADEKRMVAVDSLKKTLAYHEKNPEKHPLYPEEWKKFWNRRYKEIQGESKDPSKHDFKPEWIVFWTGRMKELHEEELRIEVNEIYRRLCLSPPPDKSKGTSEPRQAVEKTRAPVALRKSPESRRKSPELRRKSPEVRRRSPDLRQRSRSPELRRRSPELRRRSPERRPPVRYERHDIREPLPPRPRRRSPLPRRSPPRRSPPRRRTPERRRSPLPLPHHKRTRSRSPLHRRSPARTHISLESIRRSSRSPLSQREQQRNRSPELAARQLAPSMQTVLISDEELKPDDGLSPWNSDNDIDSVVSGVADSVASRGSKARRRAAGGSVGGSAGGMGPADGPPDDVVATLRQLVALEDYLGSLGPKIVDLLAEALKMEKEKANSSEELLMRESAVVLIETAKEKLKGAVQTGLVSAGAALALRAAVVRAAATLHEADKRTRLKQKQAASVPSKMTVPVAVAGVGQVDRAQIAQQMAEALIAQGKTDVSSEDLAVLVDAVVGMAEAKKRAAEQTKKEDTPPAPVNKPALTPALRPAPAKQSGTASALQMLQSAYDENDKKIEASNAPDAMDGLSDSDLETLLKNFNELSAEEQHSLIAYLKKLEAKEPERVERLRQYVSEAASTAPKEPTPEQTETETEMETEDKPDKTVVLESDDDDYTVEEVFQSATQKVKEDQIRQEMEIVKKSLAETKEEQTPVNPTKLENSLADITRSLSTSSATDLFALVQASIKSTSATQVPLSRSPNVVVSHTQPRSFGDLPEQTGVQEMSTPTQSAPVTTPFNNQAQGPRPGSTPFQSLQVLLRPPAQRQQQQQQQQYQIRPQQQQNYQSPPQNQQTYQSSQQNQQNYQAPLQQQQNYQAPPQQQQNYQAPSQPQQKYQAPPQQQQNYQAPPQQLQNYQAPPVQQQNYQAPPQQNQQQPPYNQGQQQGYQPPQHNQGPQHQQHNQGPQHNKMLPPQQQRNQPPQHQQYQPPQHQQQYQTPQHQPQQHFNDNRNMPNDHFNQGQWNPRPNMGIRGQAPDNFGPPAPYNQGPRSNFMNGRGQDNYDTRPQMNQQFGNNYNNNQNKFRGRGGAGNFGGPNRGRGRGYF